MDEDLEEIFGLADEAIETIQQPNEGNINDHRDVNDLESSKEETKRIVKPKKVVARPQPKLDATRLSGPRGIGNLESIFKDIKLKGKGHEKEDLDKVMKTLEHWCHRLYPKMNFDDCLDRIEDLGHKKNVMVNVTKIRLDMFDSEPQITQNDEPVVHDPFDDLLNDKPKEPTLTEEQKARMMRNRLLAEERRMERMKAAMEKKNIGTPST